MLSGEEAWGSCAPPCLAPASMAAAARLRWIACAAPVAQALAPSCPYPSDVCRAAATESFTEQEELVFAQLSGLCRDAAFFKSYAAAGFVIFKDAVQVGAYTRGVMD